MSQWGICAECGTASKRHQFGVEGDDEARAPRTQARRREKCAVWSAVVPRDPRHARTSGGCAFRVQQRVARAAHRGAQRTLTSGLRSHSGDGGRVGSGDMRPVGCHIYPPLWLCEAIWLRPSILRCSLGRLRRGPVRVDLWATALLRLCVKATRGHSRCKRVEGHFETPTARVPSEACGPKRVAGQPNNFYLWALFFVTAACGSSS